MGNGCWAAASEGVVVLWGWRVGRGGESGGGGRILAGVRRGMGTARRRMASLRLGRWGAGLGGLSCLGRCLVWGRAGWRGWILRGRGLGEAGGGEEEGGQQRSGCGDELPSGSRLRRLDTLTVLRDGLL